MGNEATKDQDPSKTQSGTPWDEPAADASAAEEASSGAAQPAEPTETPSYEDVVLMLEDARSKADDHWDQFLRARAELENLQRRAERDVRNAHKYALDGFTRALLGVVDSLELGLSAADGSGDDVARLREGVELTLRMLLQTLEKFGIVQIDPQGQPFDPERHEAMTMQESSAVAPDHVLMVVQKGYLLNDRLVRPAKVIVAKAPQDQADSGT
jgi:molecular chaperone GrpE